MTFLNNLSMHELACIRMSVTLFSAVHLTTKPEVSVALFVHELLRSLRTDLHQTWQGGWGCTRKTPRETCFHGNQHVVMATRKTVFLMARSALGWDIRLPLTS